MDLLSDIAKRPFQVGVVLAGNLIQDKRFPGGATVRVGSAPGVDLLIPEDAGLADYTFLSHGDLMHIRDDMIPAVLVELAGSQLKLLGNVEGKSFHDYCRAHPTLGSPVRVIGGRAVLRHRWADARSLMIMLKYDGAERRMHSQDDDTSA